MIVEADSCYYCGEGPPGEFEVVDGHPCCEGCLEDSENYPPDEEDDN